LSEVYGYNLDVDRYIKNQDPEIAKIALESMSKTKTLEQVQKIIHSADGTKNDDLRVSAIIRILETNKNFYENLVDLEEGNFSTVELKVITKALLFKPDYLFLKMMAFDKMRFSKIIARIIGSKSTADLISFLNKNKNLQIENKIVSEIRPFFNEIPEFNQEINEYLDPEVIKRMGFTKKKVIPPAKPKSRPEKSKTKWLSWIITVAFSIFPITFLIVNISMIGHSSFGDIFKEFIIFMNEIFVIYFVTVNLFYLILAMFSAYGSRKQSLFWKLKSKSMLFEKGMLSSISIIAPAYNEEMSIVESVNSLLNLNYPDFEVVVVNDGSSDQTLEKLIEYFHLERKNITFNELLKTRPVKAIYKNKTMPNLTIVDKQNGGKADALNAGINVSQNAYICGIDADSILESESLLKLMSSMLDHDEITLALGGNIFPVNGSEIDHGQIENIALPKNLLAKLQSIEYLRAFSLGRIGWSVINSLLIVSGAFGLFEKQILIECGGYLTQSTKDKDTVGEDMELVVRITRRAYDTNLKFRVDYIHNAVCYTEVPEETKSLLKQRNRWQRGLIDILSYHRKMIFNAKYKQAGLIGIPYYFIFEMVGPMLEIQGFLAVIIGLIFGLLSLEIVILLGMAAFVMGILLSFSALLISEQDSVTLNSKDTLKLLLIGVFENFGWRQFISLFRIKGIFSSLRENNEWGALKRVGFKK
jgi:cellulose synthase/poly-beta-1,6-N-acetylglucosamine synthase-like glycosyltransferase